MSRTDASEPSGASGASGPPADSAGPPAGPSPARGGVRLGLLALLLAATAVVFGIGVAQGWLSPEALRALTARGGAASALVFVAAVFVLQLLWCPRFWGLAAAGLLFGPWLGIALSFVPDTLSAVVCFFVARGSARDWATALLARWPRAAVLLRLLARERGGTTIFLLRALPIHYTAVSYAAGVAGVPFGRYLAGTLLGALPGTVLYNVLGNAAHEPNRTTFVYHLLAVGVVTVASAFGARRLWRHAHSQQREPEPVKQAGIGGAEGN